MLIALQDSETTNMHCIQKQLLSKFITVIYKPHTWTEMKQIQIHFMKNIDHKMFTADKPGRMNTRFSDFTH